jgi:hypothetical protein
VLGLLDRSRSLLAERCRKAVPLMGKRHKARKVAGGGRRTGSNAARHGADRRRFVVLRPWACPDRRYRLRFATAAHPARRAF